jgi:nucleoside-diphosphate-sugar epimerase
MESDFPGPVNVGSDEMVTASHLAYLAMEIAGKKLSLRHIAGPMGLRGRSYDNRLIVLKLGWRPSSRLRVGLEKTYMWIRQQVAKEKSADALIVA